MCSSDLALTPELSSGIRASGEAVAEADALEVGKSKEDQQTKKDLQTEAMMEVAKKTTAVMPWISNPLEKFQRYGKSAEEAAKASESYAKLYTKVGGPALEFMKYLATWFF